MCSVCEKEGREREREREDCFTKLLLTKFLSSMLKDFDMELVLRQNFYDFFAERRYNTEDILLLHRMKAFDPRKVSGLDNY